MSKLKITYQAKGIKAKLDKDIEKAVEKHGYKFIGSGYDFRTNERDLGYEQTHSQRL